ncbi:hypothetical protein Tco_0086855, partial [Tanacetum coccineum]
NSIHSVHNEDEGGSIVEHQFMPEWGLRDDLRIYLFRLYKEMITHLDTPVKDEFLGGELLKRHEQLNIKDMDLRNRCDVQLEELSRLRIDLQRQTQANNGLSKKFLLLDSVHSSYEDKESELLDQLKEMEKERDDWRKTTSEQPDPSTEANDGGGVTQAPPNIQATSGAPLPPAT